MESVGKRERAKQGRFAKALPYVVGHCEDCGKSYRASSQENLNKNLVRHRRSHCQPIKDAAAEIIYSNVDSSGNSNFHDTGFLSSTPLSPHEHETRARQRTKEFTANITMESVGKREIKRRIIQTKSEGPASKVKKLYSCNLCEEKFTKDEHLREHKRIHKEHDKPALCPVCGKTVKNRLNLKNHMRNNHKCDLCQKTFFNLHKHKKIHSGGRPHTCLICDMAFSEKCGLDRHEKTDKHLKNVEEKVSKDEYNIDFIDCDKVETKEESNEEIIKKDPLCIQRNTPLVIVTGYHCNICKEKFSHAHGLAIHKRTHINPLIVCAICQMKFQDKKELNLHIGTHARDKMYPCDICHKAFWQMDKLMDHKKSHNDKKKHSYSILTDHIKSSKHLGMLNKTKTNQQIPLVSTGGFEKEIKEEEKIIKEEIEEEILDEDPLSIETKIENLEEDPLSWDQNYDEDKIDIIQHKLEF